MLCERSTGCSSFRIIFKFGMKVYYGKAKTPIVFGGGALAWSVFVHKKVHFSGSACVHDTGRISQRIFFKFGV